MDHALSCNGNATGAGPGGDRAAARCSIVIPVCNEEGNLPLLYRELRAVTDLLSLDWEFIFVDDGSQDGSFSVLQGLHAGDERVKALRLSRNFGSHVGIAAGLRAAGGDAAVIMAADLQDPPQVIPRFLERWREGHEVVWGVRARRADPGWRRLCARLFYGAVRRLALPSYPAQGTGSFCLIDRQVIDAFNAIREQNRVTFGLIAWSGFRQAEVSYERARRRSGRSKWSLARQVKAAIDTFLAFSYAPVRLISWLGIAVALVSCTLAFVVLARWLFWGTQVPGWASLMVALLFLGGVQLGALGILGEYLWRILAEVRDRPLYVLRDRLGCFGERDPGTITPTAATATARNSAGAGRYRRSEKESC